MDDYHVVEFLTQFSHEKIKIESKHKINRADLDLNV